MKATTSSSTLYLIYDGDCILCRNSAQAIKIKQTVGWLETINARDQQHPLVKEAQERGFNLNEGILVKYNNQYYYGADAVHFLALIGSPSDFFNKVNHALFKYKWASIIFYPFFKCMRSIILYMRKIPPIDPPSKDALIMLIFGDQSKRIPVVLQKRYSNRPYSNDRLLLKGEMNIYVSKFFRFLSPLFKISGALVPYPAEKIQVDIEMISDPHSDGILMRRIFHYEDRPDYQFTSKIIHVKKNIVIEVMRFGFATKLIYELEPEQIVMGYGGYVFRIGSWLIPIPLKFLIGKFSAFEKAISSDQFDMQMLMTHPFLGRVFQYNGRFIIVDKNE